MVFNRCAMVRTIAPENSSWIVCWICVEREINDIIPSAHKGPHTWSSRWESIWEVASSKMMIDVLLNIALAKASSCFSPALKEPCVICMSKMDGSSFEGSWARRDVRWHLLRTSIHSSAVYFPRGSRLLRMVPEKRETSWLTIVYKTGFQDVEIMEQQGLELTIRDLKSSSPRVEISMPSILTKCKRKHIWVVLFERT